MTRTLLRHSPLTSSQQTDTLLNQAGVRGRLPWKSLQLCHTVQHRKRVRSRKHGAREASAASASRRAAARAGIGCGPPCHDPRQTRLGAPAPQTRLWNQRCADDSGARSTTDWSCASSGKRFPTAFFRRARSGQDLHPTVRARPGRLPPDTRRRRPGVRQNDIRSSGRRVTRRDPHNHADL